MLLPVALAAALLVQSPAPVMVVPAVGLDMAVRTDARLFAGRVAAESRRFCAVYGERVAPERASSAACERAMARRAVEGLSTPQWRRFVAAGGMRALSRALR